MNRYAPAALVALAIASASVGAQGSRLPVEVIDDVDGPVGERLVYLIREEFRKSSGFELVDSRRERVQLRVSAMPMDKDSPATAAIYSVIWVAVLYDSTKKFCFRHYWDDTLGYSGSSVLANAAQSLVARTDNLSSDWRTLFPRGAQRLCPDK